MKGPLVFSAIGLGFLLLIFSGLWSTLFPATSVWTDEKAERRAAVQDRIHNLRYLLVAQPNQRNFHSHAPKVPENAGQRRDSVALQAELNELTEENKKLNAEFQSAYDRPTTISTFLKWSGILLAAIGIVGWYATRQS